VLRYAKTLYKPVRPKHIDKEITNFTNKKVPHFFVYAKDNEEHTVEKINDSIVNKLEKLIPNIRINTRKLGLSPLDYTVLMHNPDVEIDEHLKEKYDELNNFYHFRLAFEDMNANNNFHFIILKIKEEFAKFGYDEMTVTDMLVKILYEKQTRKSKALLWYCYGEYIVANIKANGYIEQTKEVQCEMCGEWFTVTKRSPAKRCPECQRIYMKSYKTHWIKSQENAFNSN
jgi:predicted Zn-ribbon and HTH transcriptional regulator